VLKYTFYNYVSDIIQIPRWRAVLLSHDMDVTDITVPTETKHPRDGANGCALMTRTIDRTECKHGRPNGCELSQTSHCEGEAILGVRIIWTKKVHRNRRIASHLVDSVSAHHIYGSCFNKRDRLSVAFSQPTEDGKRFALKYFNADEILIY
jgi:hypothetical protein